VIHAVLVYIQFWVTCLFRKKVLAVASEGIFFTDGPITSSLTLPP
jgi:hypothetical protein